MSSFRDQLNARGWRQGSIVDASDLPDSDGAEAYLILNQTCDLLHDDIGTEPYAELIPLVKIEGIVPDFQGGKNSRKIHFSAQLEESEIAVESSSIQRRFLKRTELLKIQPSSRWRIPSRTQAGLLAWFTSRYLRVAFPDAFELRLRGKVMKKLKKVFEQNQDLIHTIFLRIEPFEEIAKEEPYELHLLLAVEQRHLDDPDSRTRILAIPERLAGILTPAEGFQLYPAPAVKSLHEITMAQQMDYLAWTRYDYLSFGDSA